MYINKVTTQNPERRFFIALPGLEVVFRSNSNQQALCLAMQLPGWCVNCEKAYNLAACFFQALCS